MGLVIISCQNQQPTESIVEQEPAAYIDEGGQYRVPTWMTFQGRVAFGDIVFESTTEKEILLPEHLWMVDDLYSSRQSLGKTSACETEYSYTENEDFTLSEGTSNKYSVYGVLCSGSTTWLHTTFTETKGSSFTNSIKVESLITEIIPQGGGCGGGSIFDKATYVSPDQNWSSRTLLCAKKF